MPPDSTEKPVIILGIDPGSRRTGYAVLAQHGNRFEALTLGVIKAEKLDDHADRLQFIYDETEALIERYQPDFCAIETPVYGKDPLAMLKLGRAQAACMLAMVRRNLSVAEYYPKAVKKSITGNGSASKEQVSYMLQRLLSLTAEEVARFSNDATDALAIAWCHAMRRKDLASTGNNNGELKSKKGRGRGHSAWGDFVASNPDRVK
jgi:crossover junction endodeoxyribonuclease RuvC